MNRILLLMLVITFLHSCGNDYGDTEENHIKLPDAINFFSNEFKSASKIAFTRADNEIIEMDVDVDNRIASMDIRGDKKYLENIYISLRYDDFPHYPILIHGTGLFQQSNTDNVSPILLINYMYGGISEHVMVNSLNINNPEFGLSRNKFYEEITLNDKNFTKVYAVIREDQEAYSNFYYSKKEGVVAFSDENNDLWVYDKIIE